MKVTRLSETEYEQEDLGGVTFVPLGEASHGTADFYRARAAITRHLIENQGFSQSKFSAAVTAQSVLVVRRFYENHRGRFVLAKT